ncbi:MAG TPA: HNH endonuclease [Noviherbaspirillum sp.]
MAEKSNHWSREQLLIALNLYCQLPFGKLHARNPEIVRIAELIGRTPSALAMKLTNIASLDPAITTTGRSGLPGASKADKAMWDEMQQDWERFALESQSAIDALTGAGRLSAEQSVTEYVPDISDILNYSAETKSAQVQVRVGQNFFRQSVLSAYQGRCCITRLSDPRLLVASHILPWRADKHHRLNPRNGLCLSALHDKAFDQGLFTLTDDLKVKTSRQLTAMEKNPFADDWLIKLEGRPIDLPEKFQPLRECIDWHRKNVFLDR